MHKNGLSRSLLVSMRLRTNLLIPKNIISFSYAHVNASKWQKPSTTITRETTTTTKEGTRKDDQGKSTSKAENGSDSISADSMFV